MLESNSTRHNDTSGEQEGNIESEEKETTWIHNHRIHYNFYQM